AVFARLSMDIGADPTVDMAYRLGIPRHDRLPRVPSIVLGTGLVSPLDMTTAYSTIASGGIYHRPLAITSVKGPNGSTLESTPARKNRGTRVIPAWAAEPRRFPPNDWTPVPAPVGWYRPWTSHVTS